MGWYDFFSRFYDRSLEPLYVQARAEACAALEVRPGLRVLDLPCGTGQSFDGLAAGIAPGGALVGVDLSTGMLKVARRRIEARGLTQVRLLHADVTQLSAPQLEADGLPASFDRIHVFLGMSAFGDLQAAFDSLWARLAPGGVFVIVDVHDPSPGLQGKMVNLVARAEIQRESWAPLEAVAKNYLRRELPSQPQHGGQLYLARGTK